MADIFILKNPLRPFDREHFHGDGNFVEWLQDTAPSGFGAPIHVYRNCERVLIDDWDFDLKDSDNIVIAIMPAGEVVGWVFMNIVLPALISYAASELFGPDVPSAPEYAGDAGRQNTVYSISAAQNAARIGGEIPVIYGEPITTPDYASQPYTHFTRIHAGDLTGQYTGYTVKMWNQTVVILDQNESYSILTTTGNQPIDMTATTTQTFNNAVNITNSDGEIIYRFLFTPTVEILPPAVGGSFLTITKAERNRGDGEQYLFYLLCLGIGQHNIKKVFVGDMDADNFSDGVLYYVDKTENDRTIAGNVIEGHGGEFGKMATALNDEIRGPNAPPIITPSPLDENFYENVFTSLEVGSQMLDRAMETDAFTTGAEPVNKIEIDLSFDAGFYALDDRGRFNNIDLNFSAVFEDSTGAIFEQIIHWESGSDHKSISPLRRTISFDVAPEVYKVKIVRVSPEVDDSLKMRDAFRWTGLKGFIVPSKTTGLYSGAHLMAMRLRADEVLAGSAQSRVRVKLAREIESYGGTAGQLVETANPADIAKDILTNTQYGGGRPVAELDDNRLSALYDWWSAYPALGFHAVFNGASTIYESLKIALLVGAAEPMPVGNLLSALRDGKKSLRTQLFTEANIVRGSMIMLFDFDRVGGYEGVTLEYRDPETWQPAFTTWPAGATNTEAVNLFGCANKTHAEDYAKYYWKRHSARRATVQFNTELEALNCRAGDRIGVAHTIISFNVSGLIVSWDAATNLLQVDRELNLSGANNLMLVIRKEDGTPTEPIPVTIKDPYTLEVTDATNVPLTVTGIFDDIQMQFTVGEPVNVVRDFVVSQVSQDGEVIASIEASRYVDDYSDWGLPFLNTEVQQ